MNMPLGKQVKGGVMPLVVGISLIIATLCSSMILYVYYSQLLFRQMELDYELENNANSGIEYLLVEGGEMPNYLEIDLFNNSKDSIKLRRIEWGIYEVLSVEAHRGSHSKFKLMLSARAVDSLHQSSLYLTKSATPMYLTGNTKLEGIVYLPQSGVQPGSVDGRGFTAGRLINGIKKESNEMPEIRKAVDKRIDYYLNLIEIEKSSWSVVEGIPDTLFHSFKAESPALIHTSKAISINNKFLGMVIIFSTEKITVSPDANLTDVILIAPIVEIQNNFRGSVQVIASDAINIQDSVQLEYPSALVLKSIGDKSEIVIGESSLVQGDILILKQDVVKEGLLIMKRNAVLTGFAHIEGVVDIQGIIEGHLSCEKFQLNYGSEFYGGYVKDAKFSYNSKPAWQVGSGLWEGLQGVVIKSLY